MIYETHYATCREGALESMTDWVQAGCPDRGPYFDALKMQASDMVDADTILVAEAELECRGEEREAAQ
jgi:hypothetical protein